MSRILIVFYSRTGHVRTVAKMVADACGADLEEIRSRKHTSSFPAHLTYRLLSELLAAKQQLDQQAEQST